MGPQPTNPPGINSGPDYGLYAPNVTDLNTAKGIDSDYYRLGGWQLGGKNEFSNGQWWSLERYTGDGDPRLDNNPDSWVSVYTQMTPKHDLVSNLGVGDNYVILEQGGQHIILDLAAPFTSTPQDVTYKPGPGYPNNNGAPTFDEAEDAFENAVICFARGTLILTDRGEVAIETLRTGDLVRTRDNGLQPIRWIGSRRLDAATLRRRPDLQPIRIKAGALGENLPAQDLLVSPQHRILVRSRIAHKMFGTNEVLVAAKQLLQLDGVDIADDLHSVEYFHMLFDRHEVVISNGAETESLYTGPEALKSLPPAAVREILALFPELQNNGYVPASARTLGSGRMARKLAIRHIQNNKPMVSNL